MQKRLILGMAIAGALLMFSCAPPPVDDTNGDGNGNGDGADTTVPTVTITDPAGYLAHDTYSYSIVGTASDNVGVESVYLQNNSQGFAHVSGAASWSTNLDNLAEGSNTIEVYAMDTSSNVSATKSVVIFVDTPAPEVTVNYMTLTTNADFTATLTTDTNWGYWSTNGVAYTSFFGPTVPVLIKGGDGDITTLSYYGENSPYTSSTQTVVYTFDKVVPVINSTPSGDITTNVPVITVLDVSDVHECTGYYSIDFASWESFSDGSVTPSITLTNKFDYTNLRYYATDIAGNVSATNTNTYAFGCIFVTDGGVGDNSGLTKTDGVGDIMQAIEKATNNGYNTILVQAKTMVPNGTLSNAGVMIDGIDNLEIIGGWNAEFSSHTGISIIDGSFPVNHIVWINDATNITFDGFVMCNATADGVVPHDDGAGMYLNNVSDSLFTNCVISNNMVVDNGGGIYCVDVVNCSFSGLIADNAAVGGTSMGGGVYLNGTSGNNIFNATISYNTAGAYGGGVALWGGPDNNVFSGTISHNYSDNHGGGVVITGGGGEATNNIFSGTISYNGAKVRGGGVKMDNCCYDNIFNGTISYNYVTGPGTAEGGGGVYMEDRCDNNVFSGTIENNNVTNANARGGGMYILNQCTGNTFGGTINNNYAYGGGGGVYLDDRCNNNIFNGTISGNESESATSSAGGGVLLISSSNNLFDGTITYNTAYYGGGIYMDSATNISINGTIAWNTAGYMGGGVYVGNSTNISFGGTINSNGSTNSGGGVCLNNADGIIFTNTIRYNESGLMGGWHGGGVYEGNTCENVVTNGSIITDNFPEDWYEE